MSRFRRADLRPGNDDGFSLTELLVAILIGVIVILGILQLLDTSISLSTRTQQRIDAAQRGRLALDLTARELRAQTCLSVSEPALVSASDSDVIYYVNLGTTTATPERHQIALESGDLILRRWVGTPAASGSIPSVTYPSTPTSTKILAENIRITGTTPLFRYYSWSSGSNPAPTVLMSTPISSGNLGLPVKIAISFTVMPDRAFNTSRPVASFEDSIFTRLADPNDPTHGQACN